MATATLMNHCGGKEVTVEELLSIETPPATKTWHPIPHHEVLARVQQTLIAGGYEITRQQLSVAKEGHRFFGVLDLSSRITEGVTLAAGVRNSSDKSFPIGFCVGNRVFTCDNLAFSAEIVISKRHTINGRDRYEEGIASAVAQLPQHITSLQNWITRLQCKEVSPEVCDSIILKSYEEELIGARTLPQVIKEWRNPSYDEFKPRNLWSLYNAFTTALGLQKNPAKQALTTIKLQRLFNVNPPVDLYEPFPLTDDDYYTGAD